MELTLWTYEGPPHVGAMRIASSMKDIHYVLHAPQGDTYADLLFTMIERRGQRPPVTYTTFQARDLGGDTAELVKKNIKEAVERFRPKTLLVGESCTAELIQDQPGALAKGMGFDMPIVNLELPAYSKKFKPGKAYKDSKLCNMVTVQELSKRYPKEKIIVNSLYPGCVADTNLFRDTPWLFRFLFPIFQKFITKGYVSQRLAGERVAQVATYKEFAIPSVHWSWGNRQKTGRKPFSQKLSKRIIDTKTSKQTYDLTKQLVGLD